ncbi:hypothetical protein BaRGS_00030793, partial [Batillaria attramentaria]
LVDADKMRSDPFRFCSQRKNLCVQAGLAGAAQLVIISYRRTTTRKVLVKPDVTYRQNITFNLYRFPTHVPRACAPRYVYFSASLDKREPVGTCYVSGSGSSYEEFSPCRE